VVVCPVGHERGCVRASTCSKLGQRDGPVFGWVLALVEEEGRGQEEVEQLECGRQGELPGD
jgi:hypothetical protein